MRAAILAVSLNLLLAGVKLSLGYLAGSQSMIADGFNNAGDFVTSIIVMIGAHVSARPRDREHPFGHGKAEHIFSMLISLILLYVAGQTCWSSVQSIMQDQQFVFSYWLILASLASILVKAVIVTYTLRLHNKTANLMLKALAYDSRNDMLISTGVIAGLIFGSYGYFWVDGSIGVLISLWIAYTGISVFREAYAVLMDTDLPDDTKAKIYCVISSMPGVITIDDITGKPVGGQSVVIIKISVDNKMSVEESHRIAGKIRYECKKLDKICDAVVHINPAFPSELSN